MLSFFTNRSDGLSAHSAFVMMKSIFVTEKDLQQRESFEADPNRLKVTNLPIEVTEGNSFKQMVRSHYFRFNN